MSEATLFSNPAPTPHPAPPFTHARPSQRLDNLSKSPIFSRFQETLGGLVSLRAYGAKARFADDCGQRIAHNVVAFTKLNAVNRWLGLRLDVLGATLISCVGFAAAATAGDVSPGLVGLALTYGMAITNQLNWLVRQSTETETLMNSVERVLEFSRIEPEAPWTTEVRPEPGWPSEGAIEFRDFSMRYRPGLPLVLQDLSFSIRGGEKIGVVGRTGSGKSSTVLALFRLVEAAAGRILVDGLDVATIGLHDLRSKIGIIPQEPTLFRGSLRDNLDSSGTLADSVIYDALDRVGMKQDALARRGGLDMAIEDGGDALSMGERQMICIARALLRRTKVPRSGSSDPFCPESRAPNPHPCPVLAPPAQILILDEATASISMAEDTQIQRVLKEQFRGVTLFVIAHRIDTIADSDRVLVLDGGRVVELAPPSELLADPSSRYAGLAREHPAGIAPRPAGAAAEHVKG